MTPILPEREAFIAAARAGLDDADHRDHRIAGDLAKGDGARGVTGDHQQLDTFGEQEFAIFTRVA